MRIPKEPDEGIEHDFRMTPTRISAKKLGASWIVYEQTPDAVVDRRIICFRPDWEEGFKAGARFVAVLDGKTIEQAMADGILAHG